MSRLFAPRHFTVGASLVAASLLLAPQAADAQSGGRMRVLVPDFPSTEGKITKAGERLSDQLRKQINALLTHAPVDDKTIRDGLKKIEVDEDDMTDCLKWQQFAPRINAALVLCGTLDESTGTVTAGFHPVGGGDAFEVPRFVMTSPEQGAEQVVQAFNQYVRGLSLAVTCDENVRNQSWDAALEKCTEALQINPKSIVSAYSRGTALLNLDRPEEALQAFQKVLEIDQMNQDAMMAAGYTLAKLDRQDEAMKYFRQYLEMNPGDENVRLTIATRLATEGNPAAALALVEEATTKPDASAQLFTYAGHFAMNAAIEKQQESGPAGDNTAEVQPFYAKAIANFEKALAANPDSVDAAVLRQLMIAYNGLGNTARALEIGQRATTAAPGDALVWSVYAEVLKQSERLDEAVAALDKAQQLDPTLPNLQARRAVILVEQGEREAVVAAVNAAGPGGLAPEVIENLSQQLTSQGWEHAQAKRYDTAIAFFNSAREIGKSDLSNAMANFFHAVTLIQQGDPIIRGASTAAAGRQAKPLFERAKTLLQGAGAYTAQASKRAELLQQVDTYIGITEALIKAGG